MLVVFPCVKMNSCKWISMLSFNAPVSSNCKETEAVGLVAERELLQNKYLNTFSNDVSLSPSVVEMVQGLQFLSSSVELFLLIFDSV